MDFSIRRDKLCLFKTTPFAFERMSYHLPDCINAWFNVWRWVTWIKNVCRNMLVVFDNLSPFLAPFHKENCYTINRKFCSRFAFELRMVCWILMAAQWQTMHKKQNLRLLNSVLVSIIIEQDRRTIIQTVYSWYCSCLWTDLS